MSVTKKQIGEWIDELKIDPAFHKVTKKELIDSASEEDNPRQFLEYLAEAQDSDDADAEDGQSDPAESQDGMNPVEPPAAGDAPPDDEEFARQGTENRPICPIHHKPCRAGSTQGPITYYYCTEQGCQFSISVPRKNLKQHLERTGRESLNAPVVNPRQ